MSRKLPVKWHGLIECDVQRMDEAQSEAFLRLSMTEAQLGVLDQTPPGMEEALASHFTYQVMNRRLQAIKRDGAVGMPVKLFIACLCDSPGKAVMWAYTLNYISLVEGKPLTMAILADWFPLGFPTEEALSKAWDSQKWSAIDPKRKGDNWLDDLANWPTRDERALSN